MSVACEEGVAVTNKQVVEALRAAYMRANELSTDTSTHVGAVLVDPVSGSHRVYGVNSFTDSYQQNDPRNRERPRKYKVTEHAERAAIFNAARQGIITRGLLMVATWACCPDCARAIALSGIITVYVHEETLNRTPERWKEDIRLGMDILAGSGVRYIPVSAKIGGVQNLFNGEIWEP